MAKVVQKETSSLNRKVIITPVCALNLAMTLAVFLFIVFGCSEEPSFDNTKSIEKRTEPLIKGTIVAVGDSLTAGLGLDESELGDRLDPREWPRIASVFADTFAVRITPLTSASETCGK